MKKTEIKRKVDGYYAPSKAETGPKKKRFMRTRKRSQNEEAYKRDTRGSCGKYVEGSQSGMLVSTMED